MHLCGFPIGINKLFFLIASQFELEQLLLDYAGRFVEFYQQLGIFLIFKSSFNKINRSYAHAFPETRPILRDVHNQVQISLAFIGILKISAFLTSFAIIVTKTQLAHKCQSEALPVCTRQFYLRYNELFDTSHNVQRAGELGTFLSETPPNPEKKLSDSFSILELTDALNLLSGLIHLIQSHNFWKDPLFTE